MYTYFLCFFFHIFLSFPKGEERQPLPLVPEKLEMGSWAIKEEEKQDRFEGPRANLKWNLHGAKEIDGSMA